MVRFSPNFTSTTSGNGRSFLADADKNQAVAGWPNERPEKNY